MKRRKRPTSRNRLGVSAPRARNLQHALPQRWMDDERPNRRAEPLRHEIRVAGAQRQHPITPSHAIALERVVPIEIAPTKNSKRRPNKRNVAATQSRIRRRRDAFSSVRGGDLRGGGGVARARGVEVHAGWRCQSQGGVGGTKKSEQSVVEQYK